MHPRCLVKLGECEDGVGDHKAVLRTGLEEETIAVPLAHSVHPNHSYISHSPRWHCRSQPSH